LPPGGPVVQLKRSRAQLLPLPAGPAPTVTFTVDVAEATELRLELRTSDRPDNHTPDQVLASRTVALPAGHGQQVVADFDALIDQPRYGFYCLLANEQVAVHTSEVRLTGVLSVAHRWDQRPTDDIGVETFEMWCPERRPGGHNLAVTIDPPLDLFGPERVADPVARPAAGPNAWVADPADARPALTLRWPEPQTVGRVELAFDTDWDHPLESALYGHPEDAAPFCVRHYRLFDAKGRLVHEVTDNHQTRNTVVCDPPLVTDRLTLEVCASHGPAPAAVFSVRCYEAARGRVA
jgi:hypothetical protein